MHGLVGCPSFHSDMTHYPGDYGCGDCKHRDVGNENPVPGSELSGPHYLNDIMIVCELRAEIYQRGNGDWSDKVQEVFDEPVSNS